VFSGIFSHFSGRWIAGLVVSVAVLLAGETSVVRGEPYLRVCKKGVIYYYFSQRPSPGAQRQAGAFRKTFPGLARRSNRITQQELEALVRDASRSHRLPPPLVKAVIRVESNFNPAATSPKGAQGLMQLMPGTASQLQVTDPYDPRENVWAGVRYLSMLLEKFNHRLPLALAAYNAGPQRVDQHQGVPPIKETQGFVRDVCANFLKYAQESPERAKPSQAKQSPPP
jgi:soluble lytic murein transglycosylase-like protein